MPLTLPDGGSPETVSYRSSDEESVVDRNAATVVPDQPAGRIEVGSQFGDYEIVGEIARGGMGVVYQAQQKSLKRTVALKMILSSKIASQESIRRFRNEAEAAAKLDHSGIVPVYDVGEIDGQHFLSIAYVTGGSLADLVKSEGPLLPRRAVKLTLSIAEAIQFAHSRNVIHRDLKPANILLDEQQPKVTDFGLAKELEVDSGLTASGQIMGTPSYMPPEQASGDMSRVGPLADIYSLGGILYFLLTGKAPFSGANAIETLKLVIDQEPVSPSEYSKAVDADVATICLKCLEKDPAKRYASATELAAELHRYLNGETIHARPVGVVERQWRWVRRYPARAALAISSLLVLVASAVIGVGYAYQSELEKKNRQVTTSNKLLSEAEKSKQKALTKQQAQAAMLLMARGRFRDALSLFEEAISAGYEKPVELRLRRVDAFIGLGELTKANEELAHMRREGDPGEFAGDVKLREAEYTIRVKSAAASVELYREALALGLPPAEEEYVRGMLAETSPLALARFRKAVQLDPFNHSAHGALTTLLTTTGRIDEALTQLDVADDLFPETPQFRLTHAVLVAFTGDMPSARRIARDAQGAFSLKALGNIDRMMEFLSLFGQEPLIVRGDKKPDPELLRLAWGLTKNLQLFEGMGKGAAFPPLVGKRFAFFPVRLFTLIQFSSFDSAEKLVSDLLEVHPEGTLYMLQGYLLFAQQKYQSAIDPFRKAITTPALHPKARHELLFGLAVCATYAGMGFTGIKDEIEKEKLFQEAVIANRELASHSEWTRKGASVFTVAGDGESR